jgi:mono/diheme cytochrome c family protein
VKDIGGAILNPPTPAAPAQNFSAEQKKVIAAGGDIYNTICAACHGPDGRGMPMAGAPVGTMLAPSLAGSKTLTGPAEGPILVLLHGLSGDIDGKKYEGLMISMATNDDAWIANVLSFVRNSFGNHAGFVSPQEVARLRASTTARTQPWTMPELRAVLPQPLDRAGWKVSASHNSSATAAAIDKDPGSRWATNAFQVPGMWFQIELPQETLIASLQLDAGKSANDYPRGYEVAFSPDGKTWSKPVATGKGVGALTNIEFPAAKTKFIRITQTGAVNGLFWSIHELQVFAPRPSLASSAR